MKAESKRANFPLADATLLQRLGRDPAAHYGAVNIPPYRASTYIWETIAEQDAFGELASNPSSRLLPYGRLGNPTTQALEDAIAQLEGGFRALVTPSGLAAIAGALLATLRSGDHVLIPSNCYWNTRGFANAILERSGIGIGFYDPMVGQNIGSSIRPETRAVFVESPGSMTFEVQDIPAIADVAHRAGALVIADNSWATPLYFKPFAHGVDISIQAATKYIVGHSDAMLGLITTTEPLYIPTRDLVRQLGLTASADDAFLALRGLRTLHIRLERHQSSALTLAHWLQNRPEIARVFHPALPGAVGHDYWKRDFCGAAGLFSVELANASRSKVNDFLENLMIFGMGASWGGFESLIKRAEMNGRTLLRIHVGLEDPADLIRDLEQGFAHLS